MLARTTHHRCRLLCGLGPPPARWLSNSSPIFSQISCARTSIASTCPFLRISSRIVTVNSLMTPVIAGCRSTTLSPTVDCFAAAGARVHLFGFAQSKASSCAEELVEVMPRLSTAPWRAPPHGHLQV